MTVDFGALAQTALKTLSSLAEKTVEAADAEKYASGVQQLNQGLDETYSLMKQIVMESSQFTDEEKLQKLQEIADKEVKSKQIFGGEIKGNREQIGEMVTNVFRDFVDCGVNILPSLLEKTYDVLEENNLILTDRQD